MKYILPFQIVEKAKEEQDLLYKQFAKCTKPVVFSFINNEGHGVFAAAIDDFTIFTGCTSKDQAKIAIVEFIMQLRLAYENPHTAIPNSYYQWRSTK